MHPVWSGCTSLNRARPRWTRSTGTWVFFCIPRRIPATQRLAQFTAIFFCSEAPEKLCVRRLTRWWWNFKKTWVNCSFNHTSCNNHKKETFFFYVACESCEFLGRRPNVTFRTSLWTHYIVFLAVENKLTHSWSSWPGGLFLMKAP